MFDAILNNNYLVGLMAIMINGIVTGFAVYIGSHSGQRMINRINTPNGKTEKEIIKEITAQFEQKLEDMKQPKTTQNNTTTLKEDIEQKIDDIIAKKKKGGK